MTRQRDSLLSQSINEARQKEIGNDNKFPTQPPPDPAPPSTFPENAKQDPAISFANKEAEYTHHHHSTITMRPGKPPPDDHPGWGAPNPVKEESPSPSPPKLKKSPVMQFNGLEGFEDFAKDMDRAYEPVDRNPSHNDDEGLFIADRILRKQKNEKRGSKAEAEPGGEGEAKGEKGRGDARRGARGGNG